jgi:UDP-2-acetamido-2,6-beta-L-arabino-hexul-4-ose reductase
MKTGHHTGFLCEEWGILIRVGITGVDGLIGWHLRSFLHGQPSIAIFPANRATFASENKLAQFVSSCDVIVHLAGMNRGDEQEITRTNIALIEGLIKACDRMNCRPHIVFSSSTQVFRETVYGQSKRTCSERLSEWARNRGAIFTNLILPHVFGEGGKPFYNSVVSTFCFQLANGQVPRVINDATLELIHAQEVAKKIFDIVLDPPNMEIALPGTPLSVSDLLSKVTRYAQDYSEKQLVPLLNDRLDLQLFNTFRSYLYPKHYPVSPVSHVDQRGTLFEATKSLNGGHSFVSTTKPGVTRGNHYHYSKFERFMVVSGQAVIRIRRLFSDEVIEFQISGDNPQHVDIPTLHTHSITNVGQSPLITLFWALGLFDPSDPDTVSETV